MIGIIADRSPPSSKVELAYSTLSPLLLSTLSPPLMTSLQSSSILEEQDLWQSRQQALPNLILPSVSKRSHSSLVILPYPPFSDNPIEEWLPYDSVVRNTLLVSRLLVCHVFCWKLRNPLTWTTSLTHLYLCPSSKSRPPGNTSNSPVVTFLLVLQSFLTRLWYPEDHENHHWEGPTKALSIQRAPYLY